MLGTTTSQAPTLMVNESWSYSQGPFTSTIICFAPEVPQSSMYGPFLVPDSTLAPLNDQFKVSFEFVSGKETITLSLGQTESSGVALIFKGLVPPLKLCPPKKTPES